MRRVVLLIVSGLVGLVIGLLLSRILGRSDNTILDVNHVQQGGPNLPSESSDQPHQKFSDNHQELSGVKSIEKQSGSSALLDQLKQLENRVKENSNRLTAAQKESYGDPVVWPKNVPARYSEAQYSQIIMKVLEDAGSPGKIVDVDCDECPCIARVRLRENPFLSTNTSQKVFETKEWTRNFGRYSDPWFTGQSGPVQCPDGRTEYMLFLAPLWDCKTDLSSDPPTPEMHENWVESVSDKTSEFYKLTQRINLRVEKAHQQWQCLSASQ